MATFCLLYTICASGLAFILDYIGVVSYHAYMDTNTLLKMAESRGLRLIRQDVDDLLLVGRDAQGRPVLVQSSIRNGKPSAMLLGTIDGKDAAHWLREVA